MILSQRFVDALKVLEKIDMDMYEKCINFAFNYIIKNNNQVKLHDVLEIEEVQGDRLLDILLKLVFYFSKYRATQSELDLSLELTQLSEDKRKLFKVKLQQNLAEVRKKLFKKFQDNGDEFKDLKWRFEIEVASKTYRNDFKPNILLDVILTDQHQKEKHVPLSCDYSNLKNTFEELFTAFKLHDSSKHKKIRNSYL